MAEMYDCCDNEDLTHECPDDAVEEYLDGSDAEHWPDVLRVKAYDRTQITDKEKQRIAGRILESLFDDLNDDYCGDDRVDPTPAAETAARVFVDAVIADFHVWRCDRVPHEDEHVPVAAWVRENRPEWITDDAAVAKRVQP